MTTNSKSNFQVLLPSKVSKRVQFDLRLKPWHGLIPLCLCVATTSMSFAQVGTVKASALDVLIRWMPLMLSGFVFNLAISILAMAIGTAAGAARG
jgi:polar amino acid transport system permease protein